MSRATTLLAGAIVALLATAERARALPSFPPYIVGVGRELHVYANDEWSDVDSGKPAAQVKPWGVATQGKDPAFHVWKKHCRAGRQTLRLERKIELTSPPGFLRFSMHGDQFSIGKVDLFFNGERVVHMPDMLSSDPKIDLDRAAMDKLHAGLNTIQIVVKKEAAVCGSEFSVFFELNGSFTADLRVGKQKEVKYTGARRQVIKSRIQNLGPSKVFAATWEFDLNTGFKLPDGHYVKEINTAILSGDFPAGSCEIKPPDSTHGSYRVLCELEDLGPNSEAFVLLRIVFTPEQIPFDHESAAYSWRLIVPGELTAEHDTRQASDPNLSNNADSGGTVFCDKPSTVAGCSSLD